MGFSFTVATKVDGYAYTCSSRSGYCAQYSVPTWELQGRNSDSDTWQVLDSQDDAYGWGTATATRSTLAC